MPSQSTTTDTGTAFHVVITEMLMGILLMLLILAAIYVAAEKGWL